MSVLNTNIKKNDLVTVITGKEKGKSGKVLKVLTKTSRVLVEKLNRVKRHQKPTQTNPQGGITEKELGIHISNVMLVCQKCNKPVKVSFKEISGKKTRVCRKCGETIGKAA